jgi:hypothetical protein
MARWAWLLRVKSGSPSSTASLMDILYTKRTAVNITALCGTKSLQCNKKWPTVSCSPQGQNGETLGWERLKYARRGQWPNEAALKGLLRPWTKSNDVPAANYTTWWIRHKASESVLERQYEDQKCCHESLKAVIITVSERERAGN